MYIGLTGLIASGKSTVSKYLADRGAYIIDADEISRLVTKKGGECFERIVQCFGRSIIAPDGEIDRAALSNVVFNNREALDLLNSIVHPVVIRKMFELAKKYERENENPIIVFDVPLLAQTGMDERMDEVWVVTADRDVIIERAKKRSGLSRDDVIKRLDNQADNELKRKIASRIIDNNGTVAQLHEKLDELLASIRRV